MNNHSSESNRVNSRRWGTAVLLSSVALSSGLGGCAAEKNAQLCGITVTVPDILHESVQRNFSYEDDQNKERSSSVAIFDPNKSREVKISPAVIVYQVAVDGMGIGVESVQQDQKSAVTPVELDGMTVVFTKQQDVITSRCEELDK